MAASRAFGRSRAAAMQGSSGQAAATFPAYMPPETKKAGTAAGPRSRRTEGKLARRNNGLAAFFEKPGVIARR